MAKQLSELMKKVNPTVVEKARVQANQEIFELHLAALTKEAAFYSSIHQKG